MTKDKVNYDNWTFTARRERGGLVPYGSTFVPLPDEWNVNWKGYVVVDVGQDWLDEGEWTEEDLQDRIQELLNDEPCHFSTDGVILVVEWREMQRSLPQVMIEVEDVEFL